MSRSERWATDREKKRVLTEEGAGPVLYCEGRKYYTYDSEGNQIFGEKVERVKQGVELFRWF